MKITSHELFAVAPRWLFLRIDTDEGVSGWGEPIVEGRLEAVRAAVEILMEYLRGEDPTRIEHHWQTLTKGGFYRGGPVLSSAVAGIDQALWDITGRSLGVPVHTLLGGPVRDRVKMYAWLAGDSAEELAEDARRRVSEGFRAVKFTPFGALEPIPSAAEVRTIVAKVAAVRAAVGDDIDLCIDAHGRFTTSAARRILPLLEEHLPLFVEEPVLPEHSRDLGFIAASTSIPLAAGERLYSRWDFRDVLATGIRVVQPDLSHAGGISEVRRIAAMAEAYDVHLAPHCPLGPIALAASLQVDLATPNFLIQETSLRGDYDSDIGWQEYVADPSVFDVCDGYLAPPRGPGLGLEIDEAAVRAAAERSTPWRGPVWHHADGSLAEW